MTAKPSAPLSRSVLLAYGAPAFVVALPTLPVYIHLPTLYGVELGVGLAVTGGVLLAARLFDTLTDPLIGYVSDRFPVGGRRRKPWIALGAAIAGFGLVHLLSPPAGIGPAYLLTWSLVLYLGWTLVAVPYQAWGAELSGAYDQRTRITGWREGFAVVGMVGAGAIAAALGHAEAGGGPAALAWIAVGLGAVLFPILLRTVPEPPPAAGGVGSPGAVTVRGVLTLVRNGLFLRLLSAWFLNGLANGIPASLFYIYLEFGLGANAAMRPLFVLVYFGAAIAAMPLWLALSRRCSKHRAWSVAMIVACAAFLTVPFIPVGGFAAFGVVCVVTGAALGADLALPPSLQADVIDYDRWRFRTDRTALQFALWGMSTKIALAAAVGLALPGLAWFGFDPAAPTEAGRTVLAVIYSLVPVVIKLTAIGAIWSFPLTPTGQAALRRRLDRRSKSTIGEATA